MIIGKAIFAGGAGGLKTEITVTAEAGCTLTCNDKTYVLGSSETQHTFEGVIGPNVVTATKGTLSASETVLVDVVAQYAVELSYCVPGDGIMLGADGVAYVTTECRWATLFSYHYWALSSTSKKTVASGVVFSPNTTTLTFTGAKTTSISGNRAVYIDDVSIGSSYWEFQSTASAGSTITYQVPAKYLDGLPHTIAISGESDGEKEFTSFYFNV